MAVLQERVAALEAAAERRLVEFDQAIAESEEELAKMSQRASQGEAESALLRQRVAQLDAAVEAKATPPHEEMHPSGEPSAGRTRSVPDNDTQRRLNTFFLRRAEVARIYGERLARLRHQRDQ